MTAQDVSDEAKAIAKYLALAGLVPSPIQSLLTLGAAQLTQLASNSDECQIIADISNKGGYLIHAIADYLRGQGNRDAAKAIETVSFLDLR